MNEPPPPENHRWCSRCGASVPVDANFCHACGASVQKLPVTSQSLGQKRSPSRPKDTLAWLVLIGIVCLSGLTYLAFLGSQGQTKSKPNPPMWDEPTAAPMLATSAESATPEIRKAEPVLSANPNSAKVTATTSERDRIAETVAMMRRVPHEKIKVWEVPAGGIGIEVLVKRGVTDAQLSDLVRTYERNGARIIFIYDRESDVQEHTPAYHWMSGNDDAIYEWRSWNENPRRVKESSR